MSSLNSVKTHAQIHLDYVFNLLLSLAAIVIPILMDNIIFALMITGFAKFSLYYFDVVCIYDIKILNIFESFYCHFQNNFSIQLI